MQTWAAIESRRNVRSLRTAPVAHENLDRILEAARRAPSARNWQPWDFITVSDRRQLGELAGVWQGACHVANAPVAIAVIAPVAQEDRPRDRRLTPLRRLNRRPFDNVVHRERW